MGPIIATKLLELINETLDADQCGRFRDLQKELLPKMEDAYRGQEDPFRSHLGASLIGRECERQLWYGFRWVQRSHFDNRMLRLFNRGHLEEARFLAILIACGLELWYETEDGGQFRFSDHGGHYGSALDGVVRGVPDLPEGAAAYAEFKTHGAKSFAKLKKQGVQGAKPEHFTQMNQCMDQYQLPFALYMAVCKDTDELYAEILSYDKEQANRYRLRAKNIIFNPEPPPKLNTNPATYACKYCDRRKICHFNEPVERNCRTCVYIQPAQNGNWYCQHPICECDPIMDKKEQMAGCSHYEVIPALEVKCD